MTQEQLKEEIDEILRDFAKMVRALTLNHGLDGYVTDPSEALLTAFNNHVDRCAPEKKTVKELFPDLDTRVPNRDVHEAVQAKNMYNQAIDEFTANLKGETK